MEGGLNGWKGFVAEGELESGMAYFSPATKTEEFIALAWYLEGGSRRFYSELLSIVVDEETVAGGVHEVQVALPCHQFHQSVLHSSGHVYLVIVANE